MTGEVELPCVPCYNNHDTLHEGCLLRTAHTSTGVSTVTVPWGNFQELEEERVNKKTFPMVLIGSATASLIFLFVMLLWAFLLTADRFKHLCGNTQSRFPTTTVPDLKDYCLQMITFSAHLGPAPRTEQPNTQRPLHRGSPSHEAHPTSIVINVTTNIKPSSQTEGCVSQQEKQSSCSSKEEMEKNLQTIWEVAQGQSIERLDYDSMQDLSLLLDSAENRNILMQLGRSLGVSPQLINHLRDFQDLFHYLRTTTYTLLPQLALAAALLPNPEVVARIHRAVVKE